MKHKSEKSRESFHLGIVLLIIGVLFLLNTLGIHLLHNVWRFWPLILIYMGIQKLLRARKLSEGDEE